MVEDDEVPKIPACCLQADVVWEGQTVDYLAMELNRESQKGDGLYLVLRSHVC